VPLSEAQLKNLLKTMKGTAATTYTEVWVQLHTGDPGAAGTSNVSAESTRKKIVLTGELPLTNEGAVEWASWPSAETVKWFSIWSASISGSFLGRETLKEEKTLAKEDGAKFKAGELSVNLT